MSYMARRSGPGVNAIGQRRPPGNFVHGGQQNPNVRQQQQRHPNDGYQNQQYQGPGQHQQNRQNQKPLQNVPQQNQQQQQHQPQQQEQQPPQQSQQQQQPRPNLQENAQTLLNQIQGQAPKVDLPKVEESKPVIEEVATSPPPTTETVAATEETVKTKPFWIKKSGRILRAERVRRRNMRLKKVLQPKNALMVLNELVGNASCTIGDAKTGHNQDIFNATLTIEGQMFNGTGKSKVAAKTAAAEAAIKSIILKKIRNPGAYNPPSSALSTSSEAQTEEEKIEEQQQNEDLSWSHIASFAIFKLFSNWDEDEGGHLVESFSALSSLNASDGPGTPRSSSLTNLHGIEQKPAKKLPENAAHLNPCMLLNQMYPHTKYEEVARTGNPPNVQFTIVCTVGDQTFTGVGQNKKAARKQAAFEACKDLLKIEYPPEVFDQKAEAMQVDPNMPF